MDVIDLDSAREKRQPDLIVCPCGNGWFDATVCIQRRPEGFLHVTGYSVPMKCEACGREVS